MRSLLAAAASYSVLALVYTYPLILAPSKANRFDTPDGLLSAWILSWDLHQLFHGRLDVFDANIFYPEKNTLALSENLLAPALMVLPVRLLTDRPAMLVNVALIMALVTSALAAFVLARHFWSSTMGGALAGVLFGFGSYHWGHIPQLQLQWAFALPAGLYFARRVREGAGVPASMGLALSVTAALGSCGYYAVYLATVLPVFCAFDMMSGAPGKRIGAAGLGLAAALAIVFSLPLALPYASNLRSGYEHRVEAMLPYSADFRAYLASLSRLHSFLPKGHEPLFAGFVASGMAAFGVVHALRRNVHRHGVALWLLTGMVGVGLSMGPAWSPLAFLYDWVPAFRGLRVPSRAGILFLLAVAVLAALGLSLIRSVRVRVALLILAAAECYAGPIGWSMDVPSTPPIYRHVATLPGAMIELPLPHPDVFYLNAMYVYRSTEHWKPLVNGYSGFVPQSYRDMHRILINEDFPKGLAALRMVGVELLLAHRARLGPRLEREIAEAVARGRLELIEESGTDQLYRIGVEPPNVR